MTRIKREIGIDKSICNIEDIETHKTWPKEFQWYVENFGEKGCKFNNMVNFTMLPISKNKLNKHRKHLPYLFIGQLGIDSYYLAYDYSIDITNPQLVWASATETFLNAADSLEQILFSYAFLNYAYSEYEWQVECVISPDSDIVSPANSITFECDEEACFNDVSQKFIALLQESNFQLAWFSTLTDQFWFKEDTCFILSRNFYPDDAFDIVICKIGSNNEEQIGCFIKLMQSNGIQCRKIWR